VVKLAERLIVDQPHAKPARVHGTGDRQGRRRPAPGRLPRPDHQGWPAAQADEPSGRGQGRCLTPADH
jgi:hypothetical protein